MIHLRRVRFQRQSGEDRSQEQPGSEFSAHQIGVLALPADTGARRQRFLHHRRGVDKHLHIRLELLRDQAAQRLELLLHDVVIIVALGIDRDRAALFCRQQRQRIVAGAVIQSQNDHALRLRPQSGGIGAPVAARFHPVHLAMMPGGEKFAQALALLRRAFGARHPHGVEALRDRFGDD